MAKSKQLNFSFDLKNLYNNLKLCFLNPNEYSEKVRLSGGYKEPIVFFLVVFAISSFLGLVIQSIINKNLSQFFLGISSIIISLPFALLSLFALTGIFYLIAKALEGEGSFEESLRANSFSTLPFVFAAIPFISYITDIFYVYILILSFARAEQYSRLKSAFTVIPLLVVLLVLGVVVGVVGK